jgi:hypothetical protein
MRFSVIWTQDAYHSLVELLRTERIAQQILQAVKSVDESLCDEPATKGESRAAGKRIFFAPPLAVLYQVNWRLNEVTIVEAWGFSQRSKGE